MICSSQLSATPLINQIRYQPRPACLVRGTKTMAIIPMEILVEKDVILEVGICLKLFVVAENGTSAVWAAEEQAEQTPAYSA